MRSRPRRVMVFDMRLKVLSKLVNSSREQGYLNLGRASVGLGALKFGNDLAFVDVGDSHDFPLKP